MFTNLFLQVPHCRYQVNDLPLQILIRKMKKMDMEFFTERRKYCFVLFQGEFHPREKVLFWSEDVLCCLMDHIWEVMNIKWIFWFAHSNILAQSFRGRPQMTSRNFGNFFDPSLTIVTLFITKTLVLLSQILSPPPPLDRDVIYGRLLTSFFSIFNL